VYLKRLLHRDGSLLLRKPEADSSTSMLNAVMRPWHQTMQAGSLRNPREAQASTTKVDATLRPNARELEDSEVIDVTELAPEVHGIMQDC
jgi:hypothetical protein